MPAAGTTLTDGDPALWVITRTWPFTPKLPTLTSSGSWNLSPVVIRSFPCWTTLTVWTSIRPTTTTAIYTRWQAMKMMRKSPWLQWTQVRIYIVSSWPITATTWPPSVIPAEPTSTGRLPTALLPSNGSLRRCPLAEVIRVKRFLSLPTVLVTGINSTQKL